ncbi:hypothetical protein SVAN01_11152 [Stagonosporopsis vannaccii]|nr:hypothetical protein SVAN01_11152 [Stagonosporopsis vannaccii]
MHIRAANDDEERQAGTAQVQSNDVEERPQPSPAGQPQPRQSCFLCLRGKGQVYHAVLIPCHRPRSVKTLKSVPSGVEGESWLVPSGKFVKNGFYEKDSSIYEKLVVACYRFYGNWKRWIPFYGIVEVREIQFYLNARTEAREVFEIHPVSLDHQAILEQCNADLATEPSAETYLNEGKCDDWHADFCPFKFEMGSCIEDTLGTARRIKVNLQKTYLMRQCALSPEKADCTTASTLGGMVLKNSPIMNNYDYKLPGSTSKNDESISQLLPGIEIVLGWQIGQFLVGLPFNIAMAWFAMAIVWLPVVLGGWAGDRNLWVAVGQLIAATIALLLVWLK